MSKVGNDTVRLGGGTIQTQSPRLCQAMVPLDWVVVPSSVNVSDGSTTRLGGGTTSTLKSWGFKF